MTISSQVYFACFAVCCFYCSCQSHGQQEHEYNNTKNLLENQLKYYNKLIAPSNNGPLLVRLYFYIIGFSDISELNMDFTLSYFMHTIWRDDRLRFRPEDYDNVSFVNLYPEQIHTIWRPDILFINEKGESISKPFSISNSASKVYPSGDVQFVRKLETNFQCQMKLQNYPFDIQICYIEITSFTFTADLMKFGFLSSPPVDIYNDIELTKFELLKISTEKSNLTVKSGTFHRVKVIFKLRRFINFYILQVKTVFNFE